MGAHTGQTRWNGDNYFDAHVQKVADYVRDNKESLFHEKDKEYWFNDHTFNEVVLPTAYLHDVIEDTFITFEDLADFGFPYLVIEGLDLLTKKKNEKYFDFIMRIHENFCMSGPMARAIKIADITCNMSDANEKEKLSARYAKYELSLYILKGALSD